MSKQRSTLNKPDGLFLSMANSIEEQCTEHKTAWHIETERLEKLRSLLAEANETYKANSDIALKNAVTAANKKFAFAELKHYLNNFINYLIANLDVPDEALSSMGLRTRRRPARLPLPRPTDSPILLLRQQHGEITVHVSRPLYDHPAASVVPTHHFHGFALQYRVDGDPHYQTVYSTRLRHTLRFAAEHMGKTVFLSAAWINPRLETGPWSSDYSAIIN
jgi:hypothetical protein